MFRYHDGVYRLTEDLIVLHYTIPAGYSFNGMTGVPFKVSNELLIASCLHDWLLYNKEFNSLVISRHDIDKTFLTAMRELGVGYMKRKIVYY